MGGVFKRVGPDERFKRPEDLSQTDNAIRHRERRAADPEAFRANQRAEYRRDPSPSTVFYRNREIILELKKGPCKDCGGTFDPVCMDFDHRPGEVKTANISACKTRSVKRLLEEIAKCDLVCANCHRLRTFRARQFVHGPVGT